MIKNLEVFGNHGVLPEENTLGQKFIFNATLFTELRSAGLSDDLTQTIDYGAVCNTITKCTQKNTFKLIEALAEFLAEKILSENPTVKKILLEIKKPWAPVAAHLETVSVEITRSRYMAYIALGSNMGDRKGFLDYAVTELSENNKCRVVSVSDFIETAPYGYEQQDNFLNACLELDTILPPTELLALLHEIENSAGRKRTMHWGPRTLDLDILLFDGMIISTPALRIPHPEMQKRDFVLTPLAEIAPYVLHPVYNKTIAELKAELER